MHLVLGITGKVGGATARHLLKQGKQVRALATNSTATVAAFAAFSGLPSTTEYPHGADITWMKVYNCVRKVASGRARLGQSQLPFCSSSSLPRRRPSAFQPREGGRLRNIRPKVARALKTRQSKRVCFRWSNPVDHRQKLPMVASLPSKM